MIEGTNKAIDNVRATVERLKANRAVYLAAKGTMVEVSQRVWGEGKLTDGSTLAYNDDKDLYAYTPPSPRKVTGKGKPYKLWKNPPKDPKGVARNIKGGWYPDYSAYKNQQGRANAPFELTGRLRKAWFGGADTPEPFQDSETEVSIRLRGEEAAKFRGLTAEKGQFLKLTPTEIEHHHERLRDIYFNG